MDKKIVNLMGEIDNTLSFVEEVDVLKDKLKRFTDTIQKILETITACSSSVEDYLDANAAGICPINAYLNVLTVL